VSVQLKEVTKLFGRFAALRGVSHDFRPTTITVILGDNGAGKSTLLRIGAGLLKQTSGTCNISGRIGYMAHASMLYDELTGLENLRYFAALYGIEDDDRLRTLLTSVDLDPALTRSARDYSQGMRQRLSLARAVVHDPEVLLLDEPFSNIDAESAQHIVKLLATWRDTGKTILLVTHQPALLERTADEFLTLRQGLVADISTRREAHA
jgi:ABC-type multidrug transport system ATPase subunit